MLDQDMADLRGIERTTVATVVATGEGDYRIIFGFSGVSQ